MSNFEEILDLFVSLVIQGKDFTAQGIEVAFTTFCASLKVHEHKPKVNSSALPGEFVKTTLKEAAEKCRVPVYIIADINKYGNMESVDYPGLIFKKDDQNRWVAIGLQDGPNIAPLTMNALLCAMGNGWRYDKNNVSGSAKAASSDLGVTINTK